MQSMQNDITGTGKERKHVVELEVISNFPSQQDRVLQYVNYAVNLQK